MIKSMSRKATTSSSSPRLYLAISTVLAQRRCLRRKLTERVKHRWLC